MTDHDAYLALLSSVPPNGAEAPADPGAVQDEVAQLRTFLVRRARILTQDATAAEDLVQNTLERALVAHVSFEPGTNLKAWLTVIMRRLFIDERRHAGAQSRLLLNIAREGGLEAESGLTAVPEEVEARELLDMADIVACLTRLPARDREIFEQFYLRRLSYREIAAAQDAPCATVGVRLLRARRRLRALLECRLARRRTEGLGADGPKDRPPREATRSPPGAEPLARP